MSKRHEKPPGDLWYIMRVISIQQKCRYGADRYKCGESSTRSPGWRDLPLCCHCRIAYTIQSCIVFGMDMSQHTPCSAIHWTLLFGRCSPYPLEETVHMKYMATFPPYYHHICISCTFVPDKKAGTQLRGQSSPGILQLGQQPSYGTLQMPQT